ncbi:YcaO-like family protein [Paractinoplanes lichenicola]|uniref:YcaO-like family protein n=1 Tax=Paractinoplanes lichenicola TaxID=2802976 RepID=A0ABS1VMS6_9ACTN|nr:YcaO-like family protein [Actinoplanes lichenicola]MBL7256029.1 YcaO-like family protein [Actinoplanes lichenicola]
MTTTIGHLLPGTTRARRPEETWALIAARMTRFGITRVADLTGLDHLGIPVYAAVRPGAATMTTSQGKGITPLLAKVSAVAESIEVAVAERYRPAETLTAPAARLDLPYDLSSLSLARPSTVTGSTTLQWAPAGLVLDGGTTWLPTPLIGLDGIAEQRWAPKRFVSSSNGLASGNTTAEAAVHGLFEVIERHCVARLPLLPQAERRHVDPRSVDDPVCAELIDRLLRAGCWLEIVDVSELPGTSVFVVYLWSDDMPDLYSGSGCHTVPGIALSRALTEAAQSRLTVISGSRDDIELTAYRDRRRVEQPPVTAAGRLRAWPAVTARTSVPPADSFETQLVRLARTVEDHTGYPVLHVDLTPPGEPLAVGKVVAPGLRFDVWQKFQRAVLPRPGTVTS